VKLLTFSTLYPNNVQPGHGIFVERRLTELLKIPSFDATVIAPVPWFPSRSTRFGNYASFAKAHSEERRNDIQILHPRYPVIPKIGMSAAPLLLAYGSLSTCKKVVARFGPFHIVDAHYFYPDGAAAAIIASRLDLPLVITARGSDVNLIADYAIPRRWILWAANRATAIVTVSSALAKKLIEIGVRENKIHIIRNGVDLDYFSAGEKKNSNGRQEMTFISVGTLVREKGHHIAMEFVAGIPAAKLVVIGSGRDEEWLRAKAARSTARDRIEFAGTVDAAQLRNFYRKATATILMSSREGMPNVILESLACATPVLATAVGGIPEIVDRPEFGELTVDRSARGLDAAWQAYTKRKHSTEELRLQAERFSWRAPIEQLAELIGQTVRTGQ
jgi:glycosyltransferase involved in cell wall biosynthesis